MTILSKTVTNKIFAVAQKNVYKFFFTGVFVILIFTTVAALLYHYVSFSQDASYNYRKIDLNNVYDLPEVVVKNVAVQAKKANCSHWDCFNVYKCGHTGHDRISVYVYPLEKYLDVNGVVLNKGLSKEYHEILKTVVNSKYYTRNPLEACIFIPSIDTLSLDKVKSNLTFLALANLPFWSNGENHIFFNMFSTVNIDDFSIGNAILAAAGFDTYNFRTRFDLSLPLFSPVSHLGRVDSTKNNRDFFVVSSQLSIDPYYLDELQKLSNKHNNLLLLDSCQNHNYSKRCEINSGKLFKYPQVLQKATFCLVFRGERMAQFVVLEALAANCIPVFVIDGSILPFSSVIDWKRAAIFIMEDYISTIVAELKKISEKRISEMRENVMFLYNTYFADIKKITLTALDIMQDRVYPHMAKDYDDWNLPISQRKLNPLFLPLTASKSQGFTAVILTYDRVQSLFTLIERLAKVPSLMKIIVVWNNQRKSPPPVADFPKINKPCKIIRTKANKLSNRFFPYKAIETEAILHIDDDIVMLTADELEFAYEVWREFPDRIVGFPSRTHIWSNVTNSWKYESEWTNEISMVLTGAAFLHKYWSYLYTYKMDDGIRNWVDENMNCEDIAMNFLIANVTNQPPIKVTPRKKFKCPECTNNEMLSADMGHMVERSQCVDRFAKIFGRMPLQSVEFRADPVLFKDPFPEKLKRFNDIGSL